MLRIALIFIVSLAVTFCNAFARNQEGGTVADSLESLTSISNPEAAIAAANACSGFDKLYANEKAASASVTAQIVIYRDTTTPFIHDGLDNKPAWKVSYGKFDLANALGVEKSARSEKTAVILLDSLTGQILRIDIDKIGEIDSAKVFRMPTPDEAEPQIRMLWDTYIGLPTDPPMMPVSQALRAPGRKFDQWILESYNTVVQYLLVKHGDDVAYPGWIIYVRGISFGPLPSDPTSPAVMSQARTIVNALTGICSSTSNMPYPVTNVR